jgi:two-component system, NtrC family, response regulator AlgB
VALRTLIVDDERNIRSTLRACLESLGYEVREAGSGLEALTSLRQEPSDLAFLDLRLAGESGTELLPRLLAEAPDLDVVVITAYATLDGAVEVMRRGARDFLPKPFTPAQVRHTLDRLAERRLLERRLHEARERLAEATPEADLESLSPGMQRILEQARRAAPHDVPVLLLGPSGTGKGVLAQAIHGWSQRSGGPFVVVNCPALSEDLLASELFGHARGAFTGAVRDQPGRVEAADGGTLFLDEIGELPPGLQAKLLGFLQDKRFTRLGESRTRIADVRVVAATNRSIDEEVRAGRFREDLYYRLNTVELKLPALRERREDILPLARRFLAFFGRSEHQPPTELTEGAREALRLYDWPGNIRELRNTIERALIFRTGTQLGPEAFPARISPSSQAEVALGGPHTLEAVEQAHIQRVVAAAPSLEEAAQVLGIDGSTLWRKRKRYERPD